MIFNTYNPFENGALTREVWCGLLQKSSHSFFTSWEWVSTWLACLPRETDLQLVVGSLDSVPVLALFVGRHKRRRHGFLPTRIINLNATGIQKFDGLTIEYNSVLVDPAASPSALHDLFRFLRNQAWDEFAWPGVTRKFLDSHNLFASEDLNLFLTYDRQSNCHFVDLQKIRDNNMDYLKLLSANKRSQIRRSIKQYEQDGPIQVREASTPAEALDMLDELATLHQATWQTRGEAGSFADEFFYRFHRELILSAFEAQKIQLLQVFNPKATLGYIYNFIDNGQVLFYQSGLNYAEGNQYRPGLVSHYYAILHNAGRQWRTYDFLAGDTDYKKSLATDSTPMVWVRFIKSRPRYLFETGFEKIKSFRASVAAKTNS